ncbi:metallophosphoesterase [Phyllobacterium myrsinacearum]|uniref:Calcineurin-like phosphoesterase domain-containing protein n=1 Tax=Phyllobacterium myrsinacearum TaxID=28101 RepID=A0A839EWU5_9HYPH|nr:metallophosphoesterase [Phyllobacterium myrsinacearum]MBA8880867.1 hypothetical protein [Phyllobacterium myrsinacearum]
MTTNTATYAIGDIHGRADLLYGLLPAIDMDAADKDWKPRIIFLGDIIDHGPHSRSAMDLVCRTLKNSPDSRLILGNHDNYFMEFMTADTIGQARFDGWLQRIGGYKTFFRTVWKDSSPWRTWLRTAVKNTLNISKFSIMPTG